MKMELEKYTLDIEIKQEILALLFLMKSLLIELPFAVAFKLMTETKSQVDKIEQFNFLLLVVK